MSVGCFYMDIKGGGFSAESHGADVALVDLGDKVFFHIGDCCVVMPVSNGSEERSFPEF